MFAGAAFIALSLAASPTLPSLSKGDVRVVLVRHGQAFTNLETPPSLPPEKLDGLTELGRSQISAAGDALAAWKPAAVVCSPAGRAKESAALLSHVLSLPKPTVDERLRPMEVGVGADGGELDFSLRTAAWKKGEDPKFEGGESMQQVGERVAALAKTLRKTHAGKTVVLVAHSEVVAAALGEFAGVPPAKRYPWKIPNGSLSVVDVGAKAQVRLEAYLPASPDAGR